ncbi:DUF5684 domain-containing protein [Saccharothrix coeruleofusca]|uniref:DUF5684 domain-containing protein n=1 Tax=Saccharothrix coeruleofusca TaxID=33919 RepID=UPI00167174D5|nr:DUF5684 domain-containing protein [Saccharothrix coeruleofusca]MBP2339061.1 putative membrane protein YGL010W [Saccharothrix coeruleofusca]
MDQYQTDASVGVVPIIISLAIAVFLIASMWKVYSKAGRPGWAVIVPIYNIYVMLKIAGRPGWWLILYIIPLVNFVISLVVAVDVAKSFGKGAGFGVVGLWLFSFIGYPVLAFGDARYRGPAAA